jgi:hypothetical protein
MADLVDWDMDIPHDSSSISHLSHRQATSHDHEPSTYVGSVGSKSPISDVGFHHAEMEDGLDEKNAVSMPSYQEQKDDRIWRW